MNLLEMQARMIWVLTEKLVRFFGLALDLLSLFFALFWVEWKPKLVSVASGQVSVVLTMP